MWGKGGEGGELLEICVREPQLTGVFFADIHFAFVKERKRKKEEKKKKKKKNRDGSKI